MELRYEGISQELAKIKDDPMSIICFKRLYSFHFTYLIFSPQKYLPRDLYQDFGKYTEKKGFITERVS